MRRSLSTAHRADSLTQRRGSQPSTHPFHDADDEHEPHTPGHDAHEHEMQPLHDTQPLGASSESERHSAQLQDMDLAPPPTRPTHAPRKSMWTKVRFATQGVQALKVIHTDVRRFGTEFVPAVSPRHADDGEAAMPWYMLLPDSRVRRAWDALVLLLCVWTLVSHPLRFAYGTFPTIHEARIAVDLCVDALFCIDLVLNFVQVVDANRERITDRRVLARRYLTSHFVVDLISSLPLYLAVSGVIDADPSSRLPRLIWLCQMLRFTRLIRLQRYLDHWQYALDWNTGFLRLGLFIWWLLCMTHAVSCVWVYLGLTGGQYVDSTGGVTSGRIAGTWISEKQMASMHDSSIYLAALYWCISTFASVGYGETPRAMRDSRRHARC